MLYVSTETLFRIACRHPFSEGNKTTAYIAAITMLFINIKRYLNKQEKKKEYKLKEMEKNLQIRNSKYMLAIASWSEQSNTKTLTKILLKKGFLGKKRKEASESDVKMFIRKLLQDHIEEVDKNDPQK